MTAQWRRRVVVVLLVWLGLVAALGIAGMRPSPIPLAAILATLAAAVYLLLDLADVAEPISWYARRDTTGDGRGADARLRTLHRQLGRAPSDDGDALHRLLVGLVDDRLLSAHGIDRAADPDRAAAVLGAELTTFVTGPAPRWLAKAGPLASLVTRIEAL